MLTFGYTDPTSAGLDDNIIRAWGRAASESGAFPRFRLLITKPQPYMTSKIFAYFQYFPVLEMVLLGKIWKSEQYKSHAEMYGWHATEKEEGHGPYSATKPSTWKDIYKGLLEEFSEPLLDVSLGSSASRLLKQTLESNDLVLFRQYRSCSGTNSPATVPATVCPQKRSVDRGSDASNGSQKKPALRGSQRQTMKDLLADFQT
ncbi:MAG: hypothetical protein Q9213_001707 [Squamulea squamosa]